MTKLRILVITNFLVILFLLDFSPVFSQGTRYGSCSSKSASRFYITPYVGLGSMKYTYDLNGTVMDSDSNYYLTESGRMFAPLFGLNLMYSIGKSHLGGGAEWQGLIGKTDNGLYKTPQNAYLWKFFGRYEYNLYSDAFFDFGFLLEAGLDIPKNVYGYQHQFGPFVKGGIFYNHLINSNSSLLIGLDYQYVTFNNTVGLSISNHRIKGLNLTIGYRFWR